MYYTGIDLHKLTSYLTTNDLSVNIIQEADIKVIPLIWDNYLSKRLIVNPQKPVFFFKGRFEQPLISLYFWHQSYC
jgi:hypothetical protein